MKHTIVIPGCLNAPMFQHGYTDSVVRTDSDAEAAMVACALMQTTILQGMAENLSRIDDHLDGRITRS